MDCLPPAFVLACSQFRRHSRRAGQPVEQFLAFIRKLKPISMLHQASLSQLEARDLHS